MVVFDAKPIEKELKLVTKQRICTITVHFHKQIKNNLSPYPQRAERAF